MLSEELDGLVKKELERLRLACFKDGKILEDNLYEYKKYIMVFSRMGYNVLKHELIYKKYLNDFLEK
jgi:hypothetical protein